MKKYFEKVLMVMLAAFLSVSFTACSDDDDDDPGKGGSMSGWVEINGKKYDFKYFYGGKNDDGGEISFTGINKNPYNLKESDNYNMTAFTMAFKSDGTLDSEYGHPTINFEFDINCNESKGNADMEMYSNHNTSYAGITATRSGDKVTIDGKNVEVRYSEKGEGTIGQDYPKTTINFHFAGTPEWVDYD